VSGLIDRLRRAVTPAQRDDEGPFRVRLVVGLGNPGSEYANNRHNVGYWTVNRLARRHGIELETGGQAAVGTGEIGGREVTLVKPRTYVNKSGDAVWNLIKRLEIDDARELLVVYDDLDLPLGRVRLRAKGGSGGYKGLQSVIDRTGSDQFPRLRIGIGRPTAGGKPTYDPDVVSDYVLSDPTPEQRKTLDDAVERAIATIEFVLSDGVEAAMQRYN